MKIENGVERIAWRFTKGELKSLLTLLGRTELPGTAIRAGMPDTETLEALTEAGIVLYCGERVLVDRVPARVLDEAAGSACFLRLEAEGSVALLYRGETLCVLFRDFGGAMAQLEPFRDVDSAAPQLMWIAAQLGKVSRCTLSLHGQEESGAGDAAQITSLLARLKEQ